MGSDCRVQNNSWPLANFRPFLYNGQSKFWHGAFTLYTWPIKVMKNWKNGRPFQISYFAFWIASTSSYYMAILVPRLLVVTPYMVHM